MPSAPAPRTCPKCHATTIRHTPQPVRVPKRIPPHVFLLFLGSMILGTIVFGLTLQQINPVLAITMGRYVGCIGGLVALVFLIGWYRTTMKWGTLHTYQCAACQHTWHHIDRPTWP